MYEFRLFVAGDTLISKRALNNVRRLCEVQLGGQAALQIINVQTEPHLAELERIVATPTLVKDAPAPRMRMIGDMSDPDRLLMVLGVDLSYSENEGSSG